MWFAGLIIGGLIGSLGSSPSGFLGAVAGAIAGAIIGRAVKSAGGNDKQFAKLAALEFKIDHIYKSLGDIHRRLVSLEEPDKRAAPSVTPRETEPEASSRPPLPTTDSAAGNWTSQASAVGLAPAVPTPAAQAMARGAEAAAPANLTAAAQSSVSEAAAHAEPPGKARATPSSSLAPGVVIFRL